jgi:3-methyladenine DNA glycosylase AlkD
MDEVEQLIARADQTTRGFTDIRASASELVASHDLEACVTLAHRLFESDAHQARMLATYVFGDWASTSEGCLEFMHDVVSKDRDWRVQEILAQAFDSYCAARGYEHALPTIAMWLTDPVANVRRAASEGLRIWTARPYFKEHPDHAVALLGSHRGDASDYVRKSIGNALRDISRKHPELIRPELATWDRSDKAVAQTYKLANRFLSAPFLA